MNYRNPALLRLANGAPCMFCNAEDGTTVAAHSNQSWHGKGMGIKAADCFMAFACAKCHSWLDNGVGDRQAKLDMFDTAMQRTWAYLWENGLIQVVK